MWNESIVYASQLRAKVDVRLFEMRDLVAIQKLEDDVSDAKPGRKRTFESMPAYHLNSPPTA